MNVIQRLLDLFSKKVDISKCTRRARELNLSPYEAYATVSVFDRTNTAGVFEDKILVNQINFEKLVLELDQVGLVENFGSIPHYYGDLGLHHYGDLGLLSKMPEAYQARVILINDEQYLAHINIHNNVLSSTKRNIITVPCPYVEQGEAIVIDFYNILDSLKVYKEDIRCYHMNVRFENSKEKIYPPLGQAKTTAELNEMQIEGGRHKEKDSSKGCLKEPMSEKYTSEFAGIEKEIVDDGDDEKTGKS